MSSLDSRSAVRCCVFRMRPHPALAATVKAPGRPYGIAVDLLRQRLWVTETATNRLAEFAISRDSPHLAATYPTVRQPSTVAADGRAGRVSVTGATGGEVRILQL